MKCINMQTLRARGESKTWFLTFKAMDHIEFRKWADSTGCRYKFSSDMNEVQFFTETDALLCYLSFR